MAQSGSTSVRTNGVIKTLRSLVDNSILILSEILAVKKLIRKSRTMLVDSTVTEMKTG